MLAYLLLHSSTDFDKEFEKSGSEGTISHSIKNKAIYILDLNAMTQLLIPISHIQSDLALFALTLFVVFTFFGQIFLGHSSQFSGGVIYITSHFSEGYIYT